MGCLGVLFAVEEKEIHHLKGLPRQERPDYVSHELEETYFGERREKVQELDKSWDAMHRVLTDGQLLFGDHCRPLSGVILGGQVLYGDREDEEDYIITCKSPEQAAEIGAAIEQVTEQEFRRKYFDLNQEEYEYPLSEEDFGYTWAYFIESIPFWKRAAAAGNYVLFTVDQ